MTAAVRKRLLGAGIVMAGAFVIKALEWNGVTWPGGFYLVGVGFATAATLISET